MKELLQMNGITKYFASSDVLANDNADFSVLPGEVHALVGENGAGKTTLMNILYGLVRPDAGSIQISGKKVDITHPDDAIHQGIGMVHQHFKLVPSFSIAQNIMLGIESTNWGVLRRDEENRIVTELAESFGLPVDPRMTVRELPVSMQQRVEILKALHRQAKILILDEPSAVLTPQEVDELNEVVRGLAERNRTIIFITHKLIEVMNVADRVSVMRQGKMVGRMNVADTSISDMARMMVGREVLFRVEKAETPLGEVVFQADDITVTNSRGILAVQNVSLEVKAGEVLGVAGVSGNGQTELIEAVSGLRLVEGGQLRFLGKDITHLDVARRRNLGMAHIPEDRIKVGLSLETNLDENLIVSRYKQKEFNNFGFLVRRAIGKFAASIVDLFSIAAARPGGSIATLSGGNLQKVVVGRELSGDPKFIIANQPTRGLDVSSIEFVHKTLLEAQQRGVGILLVSVELEEIMALSDRVIVLYRGQIQDEVNPSLATENDIGILMAGGKLDDA